LGISKGGESKKDERGIKKSDRGLQNFFRLHSYLNAHRRGLSLKPPPLRVSSGEQGEGGSQLLGAIYKADDQGNITVLHSFDYTDGANPQAGLIQVQSGELYGTCSQGGTFGNGTIFKITTGGTYTKLYDFIGGTDGKIPLSGLTQTPDGTIYGTTNQGGSADLGTVFKLTF